MKSRVIAISLALFFPVFSSAQFYVNEIMYDLSGSDTGREWVEIYNSGASSVDISGFKFLENSGASNHGLTQSQGTSLIPAGGFAVISNDPTKFMPDWPTFSGNLFKASFSSMNNTGSTLILKDGSLSVIDQVTYASTQGANGDGNSLKKSSSDWTAGTPTPGASNSGGSGSGQTALDASNATTTTSTTETTTPENIAVPSGGSAHSSPAPLSSTEEKLPFEVSAGRDRLTTVGNVLIFRAVSTRFDGVSESAINYDWSFGDGVVAHGNFVNHAYRFPGEYSVVLNASYSDKQAVSRTQVKVVASNILISRVLGGLQVTNNSGAEINLEGWALVSDKKNFVFPKDTLIQSNKKVTFADEVTGVLSGPVLFLNPMGKEIAKAQDIEVSGSVTTIPTTIATSLVSIQAKIDEVKNTLAKISPQIIPKTSVFPKSEPILVSTRTEIISEATTTNQIPDTSNTATVFEAQKQTGFVSSVLSWPIKGFNFVKRLFVED
ncbi:MAG TPA: lamin tail domain-containing protein [Candidatus Paceibacterota bacterium]